MWKGCVDDRGMTTRGMIVTYSQWLLRLMAALLCWQEAVHFHFHPAEESKLIKISTLLIPINHPLIFHPTSALLSQLKSPLPILMDPAERQHMELQTPLLLSNLFHVYRSRLRPGYSCVQRQLFTTVCSCFVTHLYTHRN